MANSNYKKCEYCYKEFTPRGITKHTSSCLPKKNQFALQLCDLYDQDFKLFLTSDPMRLHYDTFLKLPPDYIRSIIDRWYQRFRELQQITRENCMQTSILHENNKLLCYIILNSLPDYMADPIEMFF